MRGLLVRALSGFFTVKTTDGHYVCHLRGKLKSGPRLGDLAAIGDWVEITALKRPLDPESLDPQWAGTGVIETIEPRQRMLIRMAPTPRGEYRQIIVSNPDQALFVFACSQPDPHLGMLDRFLVIAEKQEIPAVIVANKCDLVEDEQAQVLFGRYTSLGYPVIYTSVRSGQGLTELGRCLQDKISVFAGPSGVGKSSMLNKVQPGLGLAVREVSDTTRKGRHTTVNRQLFALNTGGFIADTPGLKALALWDMDAEELDGYFPEIRNLVAHCTYNDCRHVDEPGCAVLQALAQGKIHPERYQSYIRMRLGNNEE